MQRLIQSVQFKNTKCQFQKELNEDIKLIKNENRLFVKADKSTNFYKLEATKYNQLLNDNITKTYKKADSKQLRKTDAAAKAITKKLRIDDRVEAVSVLPHPSISTALMRPRRPKQYCLQLWINYSSEYISQMALILPTSLYLLRKFGNLKRDDFVKFAVCPKCASLYKLESCTRLIGGQVVTNIRSHRPFNKGLVSECGTVLARKVILGSGKVCFYPHKIYCFNRVIDQLEGLLKRPGVPEISEEWRENQADDSIVADVCDGSIWRDFLKYRGNDFLNARRNLAFAINVDWFQPFKRRSDRSVGVIYLVLLNLPREQRFKWENIIVAGIVPEMSKEPKSLNTILAPIVVELKAFWIGVKLKTSQSKIPLTYRGALLPASVDLPAVRKLTFVALKVIPWLEISDTYALLNGPE
ncbi:hypothetical protein AWC38_SpisGene8874 [Stylophora pistillata]|uniref:Uncharacterized protein n=1 Tax=Stylophora pistillata TaxID=50429 RepID=A0A2B4SBN1_STYPI|nr:hypothetical protein AWC38_SpisGene8874 [Stylophora pistillata]